MSEIQLVVWVGLCSLLGAAVIVLAANYTYARMIVKVLKQRLDLKDQYIAKQQELVEELEKQNRLLMLTLKEVVSR